MLEKQESKLNTLWRQLTLFKENNSEKEVDAEINIALADSQHMSDVIFIFILNIISQIILAYLLKGELSPGGIAITCLISLGLECYILLKWSDYTSLNNYREHKGVFYKNTNKEKLVIFESFLANRPNIIQEMQEHLMSDDIKKQFIEIVDNLVHYDKNKEHKDFYAIKIVDGLMKFQKEVQGENNRINYLKAMVGLDNKYQKIV